MEHPEPGKTITAKIDRISNSGNGIIQTNEGHINIGPINRNGVGKEIEVEIIKEGFGYCKNDSIKFEGYDENFEKLINPPNDHHHFQPAV